MYIGSYNIDDLCTFYINSHTPATGAAVDADAVPGYRIYEDETGTPIMTGSMALLDDANTLGLYSEQITLSAANGFELGKSYLIRMTIVVGAVTGTALQRLQIGAKVDARQLAGQAITAAAGVTFPASVASPTNITAGVITTTTNLTNAPTVGDLTAAMKASVNTEADTALTDYDGPTNAELATALATADDAVLAQVALVKAKTDNLPSDPADQSLIIVATDAIAAAIAAQNNLAAGAAMTLTAAERTAIADAWTGRNIAGGSSAGRTNGQAMATLRNKCVIAGGVLTVYGIDDVTPLFTAAIVTTAGDPLSSIDPV